MNSNDNFKHTIIQIEGAYAQTGISSHEQDEKSAKCHPVHEMYYICWLESLLLIRMAAINWTYDWDDQPNPYPQRYPGGPQWKAYRLWGVKMQ